MGGGGGGGGGARGPKAPLLLLHWLNSLPIPNKGIESVLFLCTWSVMQLLKQISSVVVHSQVYNLRRALKLRSLKALAAGRNIWLL